MAAVDFTVVEADFAAASIMYIAEISIDGSAQAAISIVGLAESIETQLFGETSEEM